MDGYDVIVIGGGAAGCVLAARLSEDPGRRVLLLDAGPDYPTLEDLPADLASGWGAAFSHDWGFRSEPGAGAGGRAVALPRAKVVGGCSATNATVAVRGTAADYDRWAALGNDGWSFADVLPAFRALERDLDFADEWHGAAGPVPIRRYGRDELTPWQSATLAAAAETGHAPVADHNHPEAVGAGPLPVNTLDGIRMSTALTHLAPARHRPNLVIRPATLVDRILISRGRATGVRLATPTPAPAAGAGPRASGAGASGAGAGASGAGAGASGAGAGASGAGAGASGAGASGAGAEVFADLVVLAAGAYGSPAILLRSGIGPAADLTRLGVEVAADLPGVGRNLHDHPVVLCTVPIAPVGPQPRYQTLITWRSSLAAADEPFDMHLLPGHSPPPASPDDPSLGYVIASVMRPRSRGRLSLRSPDPADPPAIDPAFLTHPDDLARMADGVRAARRLLATKPLAALTTGPEIAPGPDVPDQDAEALATFVRANFATYHHPVGTCAMGPDPAAGAVVSPRARLHGIERLVVADASIIPDIPTANTNIPTIMLAERVATWLRAGG